MSLGSESLKNCPRIKKGEYTYLVHPILDGIPRVDPELLREFVSWAKGLEVVQNATVFLAPEALGIPLATALSLATGKPFLVARKRQYGLAGEFKIEGKTAYSTSSYFVNDLQATDKILVLDDVVSTGQTLAALLSGLLGHGFEVMGTVVYLDKRGFETTPRPSNLHAFITGKMIGDRFVSSD